MKKFSHSKKRIPTETALRASKDLDNIKTELMEDLGENAVMKEMVRPGAERDNAKERGDLDMANTHEAKHNYCKDFFNSSAAFAAAS